MFIRISNSAFLEEIPSPTAAAKRYETALENAVNISNGDLFGLNVFPRPLLSLLEPLCTAVFLTLISNNKNKPSFLVKNDRSGVRGLRSKRVCLFSG